MMLFKYSRITDYFKTNLREHQIWFSPPCDFNDIDDSDLRIDSHLTDEDIRNEFDFVQQLIYESAMINQDFSSGPILQEDEARTRFSAILSDRGIDGSPDAGHVLHEAAVKALHWRRQTIGISASAIPI